MMRLLELLRDAFIDYPAEHGLRPARCKAARKLLDLSSHPRPLLEKPLRNDGERATIQLSATHTKGYKWQE